MTCQRSRQQVSRSQRPGTKAVWLCHTDEKGTPRHSQSSRPGVLTASGAMQKCAPSSSSALGPFFPTQLTPCVTVFPSSLELVYPSQNEPRGERVKAALSSPTPWPIQSVECSRPEHWGGKPFPSAGICLTQGSNPGLPPCGQIHQLSHKGSPRILE